MIQHPLGSGTKAAGSLLTDPVLLLIPGWMRRAAPVDTNNEGCTAALVRGDLLPKKRSA